MSQEKVDLEPKWYVIHTYSGYENKVKADLEQKVKNQEMEEYFFDIVVPMEEQIVEVLQVLLVLEQTQFHLLMMKSERWDLKYQK